MSRSLHSFANDLRRLPLVVAHKVAAAAAPVITELARATFEKSETPEGVGWKPGTDWQKVTLRKSGDLARHLVYVAIGAKLRVALGVAYAKYQIGRRPVFPRQGDHLPREYVEALQRIAVQVVREEMKL
jgi:hypothetical protein